MAPNLFLVHVLIRTIIILYSYKYGWFRFMMIISVISWPSVLLVEETGVPERTHDLSQVTDKLYHIMLHRIHLTVNGVQTHNVRSDRHR